MEHATIKLADVVIADYNPRVALTEKDFQYKALKASLSEFGLVVPLVVNKQTGTLVSGHQRLRVLLANGANEAEAVFVNLPLEKEKALCVALNSIEGEWDFGKLADILEELHDAQLDMTVTGFSKSEVDSLLKEIDAEMPNDDDEDEDEGVSVVVGEYRFTIEREKFENVIADIREKVGFASVVVENVMKERLLA